MTKMLEGKIQSRRTDPRALLHNIELDYKPERIDPELLSKGPNLKGSYTIDISYGNLSQLGATSVLVVHEPYQPDVRDEFDALRKRWKSETAFISSLTDMILHPAYQRIIGLGFPVVPLILEELRVEVDQWFWALRATTGAEPDRQCNEGDLEELRRVWLAWGKNKGLI